MYKQMEKALQSGDANNTFIGLWSSEKAPEAGEDAVPDARSGRIVALHVIEGFRAGR